MNERNVDKTKITTATETHMLKQNGPHTARAAQTINVTERCTQQNRQTLENHKTSPNRITELQEVTRQKLSKTLSPRNHKQKSDDEDVGFHSSVWASSAVTGARRCAEPLRSQLPSGSAACRTRRAARAKSAAINDPLAAMASKGSTAPAATMRWAFAALSRAKRCKAQAA